LDRFGGKRRKRVFRVFGQNGQNTPREQSKKGVFAFSPFLLILVILGFPDLGCFADGTDLGSFWVDLGSISGSGRRSQDLGGDLRIWHLDLRSEILDLGSDLRIWGSISGSGGQIGPSQDLRGRIWTLSGYEGTDLGSFGVIWGGPQRGVDLGSSGVCQKGSIFGPLFLRGPKWPHLASGQILSFGSGGQKVPSWFRGVLGFWGSEISSFGAKSDHEMSVFLR